MSLITFNMKDGYVHAIYLTKQIDLNTAKQIVSQRLAFTDYQEYPYLIEGLKLSAVSKSARDYFATEEGTEGVSAAAFVVHSAFQANLVNFFVRVTRPKIPVKNFVSKELAQEWLTQYSHSYALQY